MRQLDVVRLADATFLSSAPLFIAMDDGFFEQEGIRIEAVPMAPSEVLAAMARGDIDAAGVFLYVSHFAAIGRGVPLRMVAGKGRPERGACVSEGILASQAVADRPRVPESMRGAKVAYRERTVSEYVFDRFIMAGGLGREDYHFQYVQTANSGPALASGQIDFRLTSEPELTNVVSRQQAKLWLGVADITPGVQWGAVVYGKKLLENRDAGDRFLRAYLRGVRRYNEGKTDSNVAIIARHTGLDPSIVRQACWSPIRNGELDIDSLMDFQRWARGRGYLDRMLQPTEFADLTFLDRQRSVR